MFSSSAVWHRMPESKGHSVTRQRSDLSHETRRDAGLSGPELWMRYFGLGGMSTPAEVESYLRGIAVPSCHDHDVLAQALNERFSELGRNHPVHYEGGGG